MMRSVSFFIISVSLHAMALTYQVSFGGRSQANLIHVTILPIEQDAGGAGGQGGSGSPAQRGDSKSHRASSPGGEARAEKISLARAEPRTLAAETLATVSDGPMALVAAANSAETIGGTISFSSANDANSSGNGLGGGGGNGFGSSGSGAGHGSANGDGSGSSAKGIALTQASYRDTPRPAYPDSARREGREGRVLLRALVDDQGRIKQVEINNSSGSDTLDRAAVEAIKRWRFHPARHGERPVESWLRIPIEFRLADANSR
jgi:protein TonB